MRRGAAVLALVITACSQPAPPPLKPAARPAAPPRILQFYSSPGQIAPGQQATLCYGVENAAAVSLSPPVRKLNPALSRCFPVSPTTDTDYRLTVEGAGGTVSRTIRVLVRAARAADPVEPPAPKVVVFRASAARVAPGTPVMMCFEVANADHARVEPPVQSLGNAKQGCFTVTPRQTTTYTLIAAGAAGQTDRRWVTITVR